MIIGIGCDMVDHNETELLQWETDKETLHRIFSRQELNLYHEKRTLKFLAGRFAAKEAVLKCVGTGMQDGISLRDIQITCSDFERPAIQLEGQIKKISDSLGISSWHVSITHTTNYSVAFVIAETNTR